MTEEWIGCDDDRLLPGTAEQWRAALADLTGRPADFKPLNDLPATSKTGESLKSSETLPPVPEGYGNARERDRALLTRIRERNPDWNLPELPDPVEALHRRAEAAYQAAWEDAPTGQGGHRAGILAAHAVLSEGNVS